MSKVTGRVKFYSRLKGFGFIERGPGNTDRDIFVHATDLPYGVYELFPEQKVTFVVDTSPRGPRARHIELVPVTP